MSTHVSVKQLAAISFGTVPIPSCTCLTSYLFITIFIKNAVIMALLKGVPLAVQVGIALQNAFPQGGNGKGVYDITLAFEATVTFSGWTPA